MTDDIACEKQCTFFQDFPCRSFAFYTSASQCFISGDDQQSAALGALQSRPGTDYFERSCETLFSSVEETDNLILDSETTSGEGVVPGQTLPQERRCTFGRLEYEKTTGQPQPPPYDLLTTFLPPPYHLLTTSLSLIVSWRRLRVDQSGT